MKKLDNKGVTLVELIVSFVIVTVAVVYFTKTLDVVVSLYKESNKLTDEFVEKNYAIRIAEALLDKKIAYDVENGYTSNIECSDATACAAAYADAYALSTYADGYEITEITKITEIEEIPETTVTIYKCVLKKDSSPDNITFLYTKYTKES